MSEEAIQPGYKRTEVGVIPEDWEVRPLLDAVRIARGQVDPKIEPYRSMILVAPDHIESGSGRLIKTETAAEQAAISGKYLFSSGDIVYSKIRPYLRKAILADFEGLCSADMYPLRAAPDVSAAFVFGIILGDPFSKYAESVSIRSGIPKINRSELAEYSIALPIKKREQEAIAEILSDVDALLDALDRLIAKQRAIKQGAMQALLTGRVRLPGFTGEWQTKRIGALLAYERPDNYIVQTTEYVDAGTPVLTANKSFVLGYTDEEFGIYTDIPVIVFDDFTTDSKYAGFPFKVKSSAIKLLKPKDGRTNLKYMFERMKLINFSLGDHKRYYISEYQNIEISVPNPKEQDAIAEVLSDIDAEIDALEGRRAKMRNIKQGMMQELLTGRIRLAQPQQQAQEASI